jgi:hypothetical protein
MALSICCSLVWIETTGELMAPWVAVAVGIAV